MPKLHVTKFVRNSEALAYPRVVGVERNDRAAILHIEAATEAFRRHAVISKNLSSRLRGDLRGINWNFSVPVPIEDGFGSANWHCLPPFDGYARPKKWGRAL